MSSYRAVALFTRHFFILKI